MHALMLDNRVVDVAETPFETNPAFVWVDAAGASPQPVPGGTGTQTNGTWTFAPPPAPPAPPPPPPVTLADLEAKMTVLAAEIAAFSPPQPS